MLSSRSWFLVRNFWKRVWIFLSCFLFVPFVFVSFAYSSISLSETYKSGAFVVARLKFPFRIFLKVSSAIWDKLLEL